MPPSHEVVFIPEREPDDAEKVIASLEWLSCHVPRCVVESAANEVDNECHDDFSASSSSILDARRLSVGSQSLFGPSMMPLHSIHDAAILFVDISGFTKLSTKLDVETLSKTINNYFNMILNECAKFGGDVLKFAGDAIFVEWPVMSADEANQKETKYSDGEAEDEADEAPFKNLAYASQLASLCGASIVRKCSDFVVIVPGLGEVATLNVHCGLGAGTVASVHVGDDEKRRELLLLGEPIDQVAGAEEVAEHGEIVGSPRMISLLMESCNVHEDLVDAVKRNVPMVVARRGECYFEPHNNSGKSKRLSIESSFRRTNSDGILSSLATEAETVEETDSFIRKKTAGFNLRSLELMRHLLVLYVHRVIRATEKEERRDENENDENKLVFLEEQDKMAAIADSGDQDAVHAIHVAEAELRNVYVMFIMPMINTNLTGNGKKDLEMFKLLNDIMIKTNRILFKYNGDLRQFIVDDKGVVLIATFGLRGSTFPNMVAERGLPATIAIHETLKIQLNVENRVGATLGKVYCGVVGGVYRHEFAALGPSVNLAARLMASKSNTGVLVDNAVRLQASRRFSFRSLQPVKAKGYSKLVPIYEPASALDRGWRRVSGFVGRVTELQEFRRMAQSILADGSSPPKMVLVHAESGLGKSSTVYQALTNIRRMTRLMRKKIHVAKCINSENEKMVPFSGFRSIFVTALMVYEPEYEEDNGEDAGSKKSSASTSLGTPSFLGGDDDGSVDTASVGSTNFMVLFEKLLNLCKCMEQTPEFAESVAKNLLGIESEGKKAAKFKSDEIVDFLADAYMRCTKKSDLKIVALDDVQWMDAMTWKVVERMYTSGKKLMIVATSRPLSDYKLTIDPDFWIDLQKESMNIKPRYSQMQIFPLEKEDLRQMIANKFGVKATSVRSEVANDIFNQCGGLPFFATEVIDNMGRQKLLDRDSSGMLSWSKDKALEELRGSSSAFGNVGDLLLHRLDQLGRTVVKELQLCAMIGLEFTLEEVAMMSSSDSESCAQSARKILQAAVNEQILVEVVIGAEFDEEDEVEEMEEDTFEDFDQMDGGDVSYKFRHALWRKCVLDTMLNERKRELHHAIATAYETEHKSEIDQSEDTRLMLKIYNQWKGANNAYNASLLAMKIGKCFENIGAHRQGIALYNETLEMWGKEPLKQTNVAEEAKEDEKNQNGGISEEVLKSINADELDVLVKLNIEVGKLHANVQEGVKSAHAYQDAYQILKNAPSAKDFKDRTVIFPIFSGLCLQLKWGNIKDDEECTYEQELVQRFVDETMLHGDPVHTCRALAMQGNLLARVGLFEEALKSQRKLESTYSIEKHSAGISKCYGSDRAAQNFGLAAQWLELSGKKEDANKQIQVIFEEIMPKMEARNVHNSYMIIYPVLWIIKNRGDASRAYDIFQTHIVDRFNEFFGKDATTWWNMTYEPISIVLGLAGGKFVNEPQKKWSKMEEYALSKKVGSFSDLMESIGVQLGRDISSILAEICLLLAKRTKKEERQKELIERGYEFAASSIGRSRDNKAFQFAYEQVKPIFDELEQMKDSLKI